MVLGGAAAFASCPAGVKPRPQRVRLNAATARDRTGGKADTSSAAARRPKTSPSRSSHQVCGAAVCSRRGRFQPTPFLTTYCLCGSHHQP